MHSQGGIVAQKSPIFALFGQKMIVFKTLGNYSSQTMHDIEQCGTFQHCPRSELCFRSILIMIQQKTAAGKLYYGHRVIKPALRTGQARRKCLKP